jgi:hypothetical protein
MRADELRSTEPIRHGAYLCLAWGLACAPELRAALTAAPVPALAERLRLGNEFQADGGDPPQAIAFLRRVGATPAAIDDEGLARADAVVHVAAPSEPAVATFCAELERLLPAGTITRVLAGVVPPPIYTGNAMHDFAYARRVLQQPGAVMPNAFIVPLSKSEAWWRMDWMQRHTYFLPRYDEEGIMQRQGHALAAAAGIPHLLRRTYKSRELPAAAGDYDFVSYFECADEAVAIFHDVCVALRDPARNPEWRFVREGPTWHGRRVATWRELFAPRVDQPA